MYDFKPPVFIAKEGECTPDEDELGKCTPSWIILVGWLMTFSSLWFIPAYAIYKYTITKGTVQQRLRKMITPEEFIPRSSSRDNQIGNVKGNNMVTNV